MKRRDFNRLVLAAGASSAFAKSSLAQMSAEEMQNPPAKAASPSIIIKNSPRTYNQVNVPRSMWPESAASRSIGPGAIPGRPIAT